MIRQQRRREIRDARKELKKLQESKFFTNIVSGDFFEMVAARHKDEPSLDYLKLLQNNEYPEKAIQTEYNLGVSYMRAIVTLETKIEVLSSPEHKKD